MVYRQLGRTGLRLSRLGFGAMRLPEMENGDPDPEESIRLMHRAFELGVNYVDTAVMYCRHKSQSVVGQALKSWPSKVYVATKNHYIGPDEKAWWKNLEDSLERLDVDVIDLYHIHGINLDQWNRRAKGPNGILSWMEKARDQGMIGHICTSFHDNADALRTIAEAGVFSAITLQYNLLDRQLEEVFPLLVEKDAGIIVMGPVLGGQLGVESDILRGMVEGVRSTPEVALRFVLANPHVNVAISGMTTIEQIEQNCAVASCSEPLSETEQARVREALGELQGLADLYCTGCKYCMPCPSGVDIPGVFSAVNRARVYRLEEAARKQYGWVAGKASYCTACGACEPECPQNIPIMAQMRSAAAQFDPDYGQVSVTITPESRNTDGIRCVLAAHNLSEDAATAVIRLGTADGRTVEPERFELTVEEPFKCRETSFVLSGDFGGPSLVRFDAEIEDPTGNRTTEFRFFAGECRPVVSMAGLCDRASEWAPMVLELSDQVPTGYELVNESSPGAPPPMQAWAGYTPDDFLALIRLGACVTVGDWFLDLILDNRQREGALAPRYHESMGAVRVTPASDGLDARCIRGTLETDGWSCVVRPVRDAVELCIQAPWTSLGERRPEAGEAIGFDLGVVSSGPDGEQVFRGVLNANPHVLADGRTGVLFFQ